MTVAMEGQQRAVRDGATGGGGGRAGGLEGGRGVKRECAPLGRHGNRPVDHVVSHAQPRHQTTTHRTSVCKRFWTPSRFRRNMPSHAAFARVAGGDAPLSLVVMRVVTLFLRHARSKSPPTQTPHHPHLWTVALSPTRGREDKRAKQQYRKERG